MSFQQIESTASRLKKAIDLSGKKPIDISRETGIDKGSISHYLSGKYEPKKEAVYRLAQTLDVSEMWLWGYDVPMERPESQKENDEHCQLVVKLRRDPDLQETVEVTSMDLANRVRQRREELNWTQEELAKRMGYKSRVSINKIENGRAVSQKIIVRLAKALGVSVAYLMGWDEKEKSPGKFELTEGEKMLLALFRMVPEEKQQLVLEMIKAALKMQQ